VAGLSSLLLPSMPAGIQSVTCIMVVAKSVVHRGGDSLSTVACQLVGECSLAMVPGKVFPIMRGLEDRRIVTMSR
jgi:hypothetical protein